MRPLVFLALAGAVVPGVARAGAPPAEPAAGAVAWPCPVEACDWAPDGRYVPLDPAGARVAKPKAPVEIPVPPGAKIVGVVLTPVSGNVNGVVAKARWEGASEALRTDLQAERHVWRIDTSGAWDNVVPVALGRGKVEGGGDVPLTGSLVAMTVPEGATTLIVQAEPGHAVAVLGSRTWAGDPPFPYAPERVVPTAAWTPFVVPMDGSLKLPRPAALPAPAPVAGHLRVDGERLFDADGSPAHLYGTNLTLGWSLPTPEDSEKLAASLAGIGFNVVRLSVMPVSRASLYSGNAVREPTPEEWDRFDALIDALARNGVRVTFPLVELDHAWGQTTAAAMLDRAGSTDLWPFFDDRARDAQKAWMRAFLGHPNKRRGLPLAQDPAVAIVEITNETGVMRGWVAGSYEEFDAPRRAALQAKWNAWLRRQYPDDAALAAAWASAINGGLQQGESLAAGSVALAPQLSWRWQNWPEARRRDLARFHDETETAYFADMTAFLRDEVGVRSLVVGTQHLGTVPGSRVQASAQMGDSHYQYDHPGGNPAEQTRRPMLDEPVDRTLRTAVGQAVLGQPYYLGEMNQGWPSPYEYEAPVFFSTLAARQGWAGLQWFTWRHRPWTLEGPGRIEGQMDIAANPVKLAQLPVAAAILRGGLVQPAAGLSVYHQTAAGPDEPRWPTPIAAFGPGEGQWMMDHRLRTSFAPEAPPNAGPDAAGGVRWSGEDTLTVDVPGLAAVLSAGPEVATSRLLAGGAPGGVSVVGLDAVDLGEARRWLLVVATRALNAGHREIGGFTIASQGDSPVLLAPYEGRIGLVGSRRTPPTVVRLGPDGAEDVPVPVRWDRKAKAWRPDLSAAAPSAWYVVTWPETR